MSAAIRLLRAVLMLTVCLSPCVGQTRAGHPAEREFVPTPDAPNLFARSQEMSEPAPEAGAEAVRPTQVWPPAPASAPLRFRDFQRPNYPYGGVPAVLPYGVFIPAHHYELALQRAYLAGRADERSEIERDVNRADMLQRRDRALDRHGEALAAGRAHLKAGDPARAVVKLTLASKLDQGDAACRVHLAQARLAQGQYVEAGTALKRALQLQPQLVYHDLKLDDYYPAVGTLSALRGTLAKWMSANERWCRTDARGADVNFLRGFVEYQLGNHAAATAALHAAARAPMKDDVVRALLEICQPATVTAGAQAERRKE